METEKESEYEMMNSIQGLHCDATHSIFKLYSEYEFLSMRLKYFHHEVINLQTTAFF